MISVINAKKDFPYPDYAVFLVEREIELSEKLGVDALIVIHGYGSHGKGGVIKKELHLKLKEFVKNKTIVSFFKGEQWGEHNEEVTALKKQEPELILHPLLNNLNSGVTVVWIRKKWNKGKAKCLVKPCKT